jgi:hypothetical protein
MTYNTPELLTVGTAQNLVLGSQDVKSPILGLTNFDDASHDTYGTNPDEPDGMSW